MSTKALKRSEARGKGAKDIDCGIVCVCVCINTYCNGERALLLVIGESVMGGVGVVL